MSSVDGKHVKTEPKEQTPDEDQQPPQQNGSTEFLEALIHHGNSKKQGSAFLEKLFDILMNEEYENYISWCADGKSILIKEVVDFSQIVLPKYYKHNNFQSFVRQLNMYNFTKTSHDANRREFKQPLFRKGKRNLLPLISRKTQKAIRSIDSTLENIDANDLFDVTSSQSERLEGKPLIRCKSIDSCPGPESESSPLWGVVQELRMRVNALEKKIYQDSKEKQHLQQNNNISLSSSSMPNHFSHFNSNTVSSCSNCSKNQSSNQNSNDCSPQLKKMRSNSDKSTYSSSSMISEEEDGCCFSTEGNGKIAPTRSRSISFSSYESCSTDHSSSQSSTNGYSRGCEEQGSSLLDRAPNKRGVDAILSAAEILHDNRELPLPQPFPVLLPSGACKEKIGKMASATNTSLDNIENETSLKKLKPLERKRPHEVEFSSNDTETEGCCDSNSDSSASPLYFQEKDDQSQSHPQEEHRTAHGHGSNEKENAVKCPTSTGTVITPHASSVDVASARMDGLPLSRAATIS